VRESNIVKRTDTYLWNLHSPKFWVSERSTRKWDSMHSIKPRWSYLRNSQKDQLNSCFRDKNLGDIHWDFFRKPSIWSTMSIQSTKQKWKLRNWISTLVIYSQQKKIQLMRLRFRATFDRSWGIWFLWIQLQRFSGNFIHRPSKSKMKMGITIEMSQLISRISLGSILKITEKRITKNNKIHIRKKTVFLICKNLCLHWYFPQYSINFFSFS